MKSSINGVATNKDDNTLCLACHAEGGDFTALPKSSIGNLSAELGVVNTHLNAKLGYVGLDAGQYLSSVTKAGTSFPAFGNNTIKVGNCVSCHMPLTVVSGIQRDPATGLTAGKNVRGVGDVHNHTMKTVKASEVNGKIVLGGAVNGKAGGAASADGLPSATNTGVMTSCSVCHVPTDAAPSTGGNWW